MKEILIILIILLLFILLINYYIKNKGYTKVKSSIDNRYYLVEKCDKQYECADKLAFINIQIEKLLNSIKYSKNEKFKRLCKKYEPECLGEHIKINNKIAYSVNKGEEIRICLKDEDGELLDDDNLLMFVVIHELAHVMSLEEGHTDTFWNNMNMLLIQAEKINIYKPENYYKNPKIYCGKKVDKTPYRF